jgi:hypothetical protein
MILNEDHLTQFNDFSGLRYGSIYPTDIDGLIEIQDKLFIFIELKYQEAKVPVGQKLALERITRAIDSIPGKRAFCFIATHNDKKRIDVSQATVKYFMQKGEWKTPKRLVTVREAIDVLIDTHIRQDGVTYE